MFQSKLNKLCDDEVIVLKFTATWCKPCQFAKPVIDDCLACKPPNLHFCEIDIDKNVDLYLGFKSKKMLKGVPTLMAFYGDRDHDTWYIPDEIVSGADEKSIRTFFEEIKRV